MFKITKIGLYRTRSGDVVRVSEIDERLTFAAFVTPAPSVGYGHTTKDGLYVQKYLRYLDEPCALINNVPTYRCQLNGRILVASEAMDDLVEEYTPEIDNSQIAEQILPQEKRDNNKNESHIILFKKRLTEK